MSKVPQVGPQGNIQASAINSKFSWTTFLYFPIMNPFEPSIKTADDTPSEAISRSGFFSSVACIGVAMIAVPAVAYWAIQIINSLMVSGMGTWMGVLMVFSFLVSPVVGFSALFLGRWLNGYRIPFDLILLPVTIAITFPLTYQFVASITLWKIQSFWIEYGTLLGSISMVPILVGAFTYCLAIRIGRYSKSARR